MHHCTSGKSKENEVSFSETTHEKKKFRIVRRITVIRKEIQIDTIIYSRSSDENIIIRPNISSGNNRSLGNDNSSGKIGVQK
jgi:hypothetical protein